MNKEALVVRALVDPTTGDLLSVKRLDQRKTDQIVRSHREEIGNVVALKLYLPDSKDLRMMKNQLFLDYDIVRKKREFKKVLVLANRIIVFLPKI